MPTQPEPARAATLDDEHAQLLDYVEHHPNSYGYEIADHFWGRWECGWPIPGVFYVNSFLGHLVDEGYLQKKWNDKVQSLQYTAAPRPGDGDPAGE